MLLYLYRPNLQKSKDLCQKFINKLIISFIRVGLFMLQTFILVNESVSYIKSTPQKAWNMNNI